MVIELQRKDRNDGFDVDFLRCFSVILSYQAAKPYLFFRDQLRVVLVEIPPDFRYGRSM
jgi:hypothetical protein